MKKIIATLLLITLPVIALAQSIDGIAAVVNDEIITTTELEQKTTAIRTRLTAMDTQLPDADTLKRQVLEKMIMARIQLQMAQEHGINASETKINATIRRIAKQQQLSINQLRDSLKEQGISFAEFRDSVKDDLLISQLQQYKLESQVNITDSELENFLNSPAGQNQAGIEYNVAHILIAMNAEPDPKEVMAKKSQAINLVKQLKAGDTKFSTAAMSQSAGRHALEGGKLGWHKLDELPTLFVKHIATLLPNEIYGPIRSPNGFHIIKLLGKRLGKQNLVVESKVQHILIDANAKRTDAQAKEKIIEIRNKILKGADFSKLAKAFSVEASSANNGGNLGWIDPKNTLPEINKQIAQTKTNAVSQPFKSTLGWHIIKVIERRNQQGSKLSKSQALDILYDRKFNAILPSWLKEIRSQAKIEILL